MRSAFNLIHTDENTDRSAMKSADEALGYCAALLMRHSPHLLPMLEEAQRRLRRRTNPEMFNQDGKYN